MNEGCVLSEEELAEIEYAVRQRSGTYHQSSWVREHVESLIATIRDLQRQMRVNDNAIHGQLVRQIVALDQQNGLMLSALERMSDEDHDDSHWYMEFAEETLAKVRGGDSD